MKQAKCIIYENGRVIKQYSYSISKYGQLAHVLAGLSKRNNRRYESLVVKGVHQAYIIIYKASENKYYSTIIDLEYAEWASTIKWRVESQGNSRTRYIASENGKLHRLILGLDARDSDKIVDHINRNGLDNRRSNLRIVDSSTNKKNSIANSNSTTGIRGVKFEPASRNRSARWRAFWSNEKYQQQTKSFSVNKYGYDTAKQMAIDYRKEKEKEFGYL